MPKALIFLLLCASVAEAQTAPPAPPPTPATAMREPLAGYANGNFYLRDPNDWFVLFPKGRMHIDWYNFLNRGDPPSGVEPNSSRDPRPRDTLFIRRARAEVQGTIFKHFDFHIAGEFANVPGAGSSGSVADAYVIVNYFDWMQLEVGQFDVPFTLENRISNKYFDFMERSVAIRAFAVPSDKDQGAFLFGWLPQHVAYYSLGAINGVGQNFRNQDNHAALIGRAFIAPLAPLAHGRRWMEDIWAGGSFWWRANTNLGGSVTPNPGGAAQNDLPSMTTQGGFGFFSSNYANGRDAAGNTLRAHLVPAGDTVKWAVEANLPIKKIGLRFELAHQSIDLAEYNDSNPGNATFTRSGPLYGGRLEGTGYYVEVFGWLLGDVNYLETPGLQTAPHIRKFAVAKEPQWGLMLAAKYEHVGFDVNGLRSQTDAMGTITPDPGQGHYQIDVFELGVNAWATKHVRMTANYVLNYIDGDSANVKRSFYYQKAEHELLFRLAIAL